MTPSNTRESGMTRTRETGKECRFGLMGPSMKDSGKTIKPMEEGALFMLVVMSTRVIGRTTKHTGRESTLTKMVQSMKVVGLRTNSTDRAKKHSLIRHILKVSSKMALKKGKADSIGLMAPLTKEISKTMR
jgi:hypothetical protein